MNYRIADQPTPATVEDLLGEAKRRSACLSVFTECTVEYDGRANASLASGDRLVVYKPDGTVLVHTDEQRTPQNWQPPGATFQLTSHDPLTLVATRTSPRETISIQCGTVYYVALMRMTDDADIALQGSEDDLRDLLFDQPSLIEEGFRPREREHDTPAGPVDVWGYDDDGTPVILELKRRGSGPTLNIQRLVCGTIMIETRFRCRVVNNTSRWTMSQPLTTGAASAVCTTSNW
jgi:Predicted nuclease of the RecB family